MLDEKFFVSQKPLGYCDNAKYGSDRIRLRTPRASEVARVSATVMKL
jgi:hypothetical protein